MTLVEVMIIIVVLGVLAALLLPALSKAGNQRWVACVNNLRQIGLCFQVFANDHQQKFPMQVSTNEGGSQEYSLPGDLFKHFIALSNQIGRARILTCPVDPLKRWAQEPARLSNGNISYFLGLDAGVHDPASFLSGDRTLTNAVPSAEGLMTITSTSRLKWNEGMHHQRREILPGSEPAGQVAFGDGSVRRLSQADLKRTVRDSSPGTNRVLLP